MLLKSLWKFGELCQKKFDKIQAWPRLERKMKEYTVKSFRKSPIFTVTFNSTGSESDGTDTPAIRQKSTEYDPLDNYLSDEDGKKDIELCVIKVSNENGQSVEVV